jgi:tryptophanyl-tRNA synthetase
MKPRILTGIRPTGALHLGHFFGMLEQTVLLQSDFDVFLMIADVQALTDHFHQPERVRAAVFEVVRDALVCGVDPVQSPIFIQSLIPEIAELTVFLSNLVSVARLESNPTVKAEIALKRDVFGDSVSFGFLGYPVSQAADITVFDAVCVPVGDDQLPMLELTRDVVRKFNRLYGETLFEPEARVVESARIMGLDGASKMGKSLGNAVFLSDSSDVVSSKVMGAVTDPLKIRLKDVGHPEGCTVFSYHQLFHTNTSPNIAQIEFECRSGARGCVLCKKELASTVNAFLEPKRVARADYSDAEILRILLEGTQKARVVARATLARVKQAMKLEYGEAA